MRASLSCVSPSSSPAHLPCPARLLPSISVAPRFFSGASPSSPGLASASGLRSRSSVLPLPTSLHPALLRLTSRRLAVRRQASPAAARAPGRAPPTSTASCANSRAAERELLCEDATSSLRPANARNSWCREGLLLLVPPSSSLRLRLKAKHPDASLGPRRGFKSHHQQPNPKPKTVVPGPGGFYFLFEPDGIGDFRHFTSFRRSFSDVRPLCFFPDRITKQCCEIRQVLRMFLGNL